MTHIPNLIQTNIIGNPSACRDMITSSPLGGSQAGAYFVTIVTYQRDCLFGKIIDGEMYINEYGRIAQKWWSEIPNHFPNVELGAYVIMPNHVHGIIWITAERRGEVLSPRYNPNKNNLDADVDETSNQGGETPPLRKWTLGQIVAYFKYQSTKEMNHIETKNAITKFWQRNYYEHIICKEPPPNGTPTMKTHSSSERYPHEKTQSRNDFIHRHHHTIHFDSIYFQDTLFRRSMVRPISRSAR
jgi:putative transposase